MSIVQTITIIVQVVEMLGYGLQAKMNLKLIMKIIAKNGTTNGLMMK